MPGDSYTPPASNHNRHGRANGAKRRLPQSLIHLMISALGGFSVSIYLTELRMLDEGSRSNRSTSDLGPPHPQFYKEEGMNASTDNEHTTGGYDDMHNQSHCIQTLDALDHQFNQRRIVRQEAQRSKRYARKDLSARNWFDPFEPEATCFTEERLGSGKRYQAYGDGPKFVCGVDVLAKKSRSHAGCLVYSVGSNNQISFEKSIYRLTGCETHTFDPTVSDFVGKKYATFHPWGLGRAGKKAKYEHRAWVAKSLEGMMIELGHANRTIDVLKIDCEGCEYESMVPFLELVASGKAKVDQLQIELHMRSLDDLKDFFEATDKAKLRIFHKERNHWGCNGYICVEYAFASESFLREANRAVLCPQ
ncbi:hypothetical protein ACHAWF_006337 [Thalassiosira exigua]